MSHYKLFVESHRVTLVEQETGRRESWSRAGPWDIRWMTARVMCRRVGISMELEEIL